MGWIGIPQMDGYSSVLVINRVSIIDAQKLFLAFLHSYTRLSILLATEPGPGCSKAG